LDSWGAGQVGRASGALPAGGNLLYLDCHVAWMKFQGMRVRTTSGFEPQFWW
jgi:prepilin-type processing-associated H-X9-DG protein